jgi:hypothetical protein
LRAGLPSSCFWFLRFLFPFLCLMNHSFFS